MPEIPAAVNEMLLNFKDPGHSKFFVFSFCGKKKLFKLAPGVLTSFSAARGVAYEIRLILCSEASKRISVSSSKTCRREWYKAPSRSLLRKTGVY